MNIHHKNLMGRENTGNDCLVAFGASEPRVLAQVVFVNNIKGFLNKFSINKQKIKQR